MNFEQLEQLIARNSSVKGLEMKQTTIGDTFQNINNTSMNSMANQNDKMIEIQQNATMHMSPKDQKNATSTNKSFLTSDNISFNLYTTQQSALQNCNNETVGLLKEQLTKIKLLTTDLQIKDQQIEIIKEQVQELENDKHQLEQHMYDLDKQLRLNEDDFNIRLLQLQENNESIVEYNQQLKERVGVQNEQIQSCQQDLAQYRLIVDRYESDKQNLINEVTQVKGVLKGIQQATVGSREQMSALFSENEKKGKDIENKNALLQQMEQEITKQSLKIEKLQKSVFQKDEKIAEYEQQLTKLEKFANENSKLAQENSQLRVDLNSLKIRFDESMRSLEDTRASLARQIQSKNQFEENADNLSRELQQCKKIQGELKKKNEQLITDNLSFKEQIIEFEQINRRLQRDQDIVILELGEFAKEKLDDLEGDDVLFQLRNHSASLTMASHNQSTSASNNNNRFITKNTQMADTQEDYLDQDIDQVEEEDQDQEEDDEDKFQLYHHFASAQESNTSMSFLNQSRASIKGFQNAIISNKLSSVDGHQKSNNGKRSSSRPSQSNQNSLKRDQSKKKKSVSVTRQSNNESISNSKQQINLAMKKQMEMEGMSGSEQLRSRIGYLASMIAMYKKKVDVLEQQQQNLNATIEKLQDHTDQLQKMTIINKAQNENTIFSIKEEYEEQIMRMKDIYERKVDDHQNRHYENEEQILTLQGEIEFHKQSIEQKNSELAALQHQQNQADKELMQMCQLKDDISGLECKLQLTIQVLLSLLSALSNIYYKYNNTFSYITFYKKFFNYYTTLNAVLHPLHNHNSILENNHSSSYDHSAKGNVSLNSQAKKQYIYKVFRKAVYSIIFIYKLRLRNGHIDSTKQQNGLHWPNHIIKSAFLHNIKSINQSNLIEEIYKIIDINCLRNPSNKESKQTFTVVSEIIKKFNQNTNQSLEQQSISRNHSSKDDAILSQSQKDSNKVYKMIKQNETFQSELNKMGQRVLGLSDYTRQIENKQKDQEKQIEMKFIKEIKDKENTITVLKTQLLETSNQINQFSHSHSSINQVQNKNENQIILQSSNLNNRSYQSLNYNHSLIPPLHSSLQQSQQQQSSNVQENRSFIKNQSSLIRKQYSQGEIINSGLQESQQLSQSHSLSQSNKSAVKTSSQQDLHNQIQQYKQQQQQQQYHQNLENQSYYGEVSNVESQNSIIQNEHISVDSLQNELSKIMQRKNLRDSSTHSSASKLVKCPGKIVRNTKL